MRKRGIPGRGAAAAGLLWGAAAVAPVPAATFDFEAAAYVPGASLHGVDRWSLSSEQGGDAAAFLVQAEGGDKVLRVQAAGVNTLFRDVSDLPAGIRSLDLRWEWKAPDRKADVCLGVSSPSGNARAAVRALACFHPEGRVAVATATAGVELTADGQWTPGVRFAMRMRLDLVANAYTLYMGGDSLRSDETLVAGPLPMAGLASERPTRLVVRTEDGAGYVDVDDIALENVVHWLGGGDGLAATAANWSGGTAPDSQTHVVFDARAAGPVAFDRAFAARSLTVEKGFAFGFDLGAATLSLSGKGDFTGLKSPRHTTGVVRLHAPRAQSLVGPENVAMPPVLHDGAGLLRLDGRPLLVEALTQTAGTLDLNGKDVTVAARLHVRNGGPASVRGLDGRSLTVGGTARFEGAPGSLLALRGATTWNVAAGDTLAASRVELGNSKALSRPGSAVASTDLGGNVNWTFAVAGLPVLLAHPQPGAYLVGETAALKVSADGGGQPLAFQWLKGGQPLAGETDSVLVRPGLALSDNGAYACRVGNASGTVLSQAATLAVTFPAPAAQPGTSDFAESLTVRITTPVAGAKLYVSRDGGAPAALTQDLVLRATTTVSAFAVLGKDTSQTGAWRYTRAPLDAPTASPRGRAFPDTLRIALGSRTADARIHFTLDGRTPDAGSPLYREPILLDSSAVLKAVAVKDGAVSDTILTETYELVPDSLVVSPRGGDYPAGIVITLSSTSRRAAVYYTLDGSDPVPGDVRTFRYTAGIPLDTGAVLKAVATAGEGAARRTGRMIAETYTFFQAGVRTLESGRILDIGSRYSLSNPSAGAPAVLVEVQDRDSLKALAGFRDIQFALRVSLATSAAAFPKLVFAAPEGEERALYRHLAPSDKVEFVARGPFVQLPGSGTYFLGVDTLPPRITVNGESFAEGDSTRIVLSVEDNVSSLVYDLERSDVASPALQGAKLGNPAVMPLTLKAPAPWAPLWIRLRVHDQRNTSWFPADSTAEYPLSRKVSAPQASPRAFRLGTSAARPWDLVAFPLEAQGRITLGALKANNAVKGLAARVWDPAAKASRPLGDDDPIPAGAAVWMGSLASASSLVLPPFQTAPRNSREAWRLTLKPGWNQVSNPSLRPLIWPSHRGAHGYPNSPVKGLHGYDPRLPGDPYFQADTLLPWRGYFVLHNGDRDTTVTLRTTPVPSGPEAAPKPGGYGADGVRLVLGMEGLASLELGATPASVDGLGIEDETRPPALDGEGPGLWSVRGRARLGADYVRWRPGALLAWTVLASRPAASAGDAGLRLERLRLPEGYALFAVSAARGLKFDLSAAGAVPLSPGGSDSLEVIAGPRAALEAHLAGVPAAVEAFRAAVRPQPGGYRLELDLPRAADVRWSLHGLDGRIRDRAALALPAGHYALPRRVAAGALPAGAYVLRLEWSAAGDGAGTGAKGGFAVRRVVLQQQ